MRNKFIWLIMAALLLLSTAFFNDGDAQPPGKKGFGKKGGGFPVTSDQLVERLMSFDKNNTGKITAADLPERMQHFIALGDVNKDGALDRDEIRKLATTLEAFASLTTPTPGKGGKGDKGGKGGKGGPKGDFFGKGGPKGAPKSVAEAERTLDDLNVTGSTRDRADRILQAQSDKLKKFDELSRAELVVKMKDVLNDEDYRAFKSALSAPVGPKGGFKGGKGDFKGGFKGDFKKGPPDMSRRIDQLQKELEDLRKQLKS